METVRDTCGAVVREVQRRESNSSCGGPLPLMGIWPMASLGVLCKQLRGIRGCGSSYVSLCFTHLNT